MAQDDRLLKLAQYLRKVVEKSGLKLHPFHKQYGYDKSGRAILSPTTFRNLVNDPSSFPDKKTFDGLSVILSKAAGKEVPASFLMKLCDVDMTYAEVEDEDQSLDSAPTRADLLVRRFTGLPYRERCRIAAELMRVMADDSEYATLDTRGQIAWLIRKEMRKQGMGVESFAEKFVGLPVEIIEKILGREDVTLTKAQILILLGRVRGVDGSLLLDESDVRQSPFTQVLAPHLCKGK